jgi:hypothetical protein
MNKPTSWDINGHQWTPMDTNEKQWKAMKSNEKQWKAMKSNEKQQSNEKQWKAMHTNANQRKPMKSNLVSQYPLQQTMPRCHLFFLSPIESRSWPSHSQKSLAPPLPFPMQYWSNANPNTTTTTSLLAATALAWSNPSLQQNSVENTCTSEEHMPNQSLCTWNKNTSMVRHKMNINEQWLKLT